MIRTPRTSTVVTLVVAVLFLLLPAVPAGGTAQHAAGLVVDTGERVVTVYVEFPEGASTITGEELLRRADVDAVFADYGSMGKAVCSILGVGSPQDDCFREAERNGLYWNYSRAEDGGWQRSSQGVSSTTVEHGDVDGWAWGSQGSEPPYYSFEEIRDRHEPEPSPTPEPTPTAEPSPTAEETSGEAPESDERAPEPEPEAVDTPVGAAPTEATSQTDTGDDPTPERTGDTRERTPTPEPAVTASSSDEPAIALGDPASTGRRILPLASFLGVMAALIGAIAWRRRVRSGTRGGPPAT